MRSLVIGLITLVAFAACKRSVEGETRRWENALRSVDELAVLHPGFKPALEEQRAKAQAAMDAAKAISDEKQRISSMAAANDLLTAGFVGQLRDVDGKIKQIRKKIVEVTGSASDPSDRLSARQAAEGAERTLAALDATLGQGARDAASAEIILRKITSDLRAAEDNLDSAARLAKSKQAPAKSGEAQPGQPGAAQPAQAEQSWTCEYCNTANPAGADTCGNCGAAKGR